MTAKNNQRKNSYKNTKALVVISLSLIFSFITACASNPGSNTASPRQTISANTEIDPILFDCFDSAQYFRRAAASYQQGISLDKSLATIQAETNISYALKVKLTGIVTQTYRDKPENFLVYGRDQYNSCENSYGRGFKQLNTDACYTILFAIDIANNLKQQGIEAAVAKKQINDLFKMPDMSKLGLRSMPDVVVADLYRGDVTLGNYSRRRFFACTLQRSAETKNLRVTEILSGDHFIAEDTATGTSDEYFVKHLKAPREGESNFELAKQKLADNILNKEFSSEVIYNPNGYSEAEVDSRLLRLLSQDGMIVQRESEPHISDPLGGVSTMTLSLLSYRNRSSSTEAVSSDANVLLWGSLRVGMSVAEVKGILPEAILVDDGMTIQNGSSEGIEKVRLNTTVYGFDATGRMYFDAGEKLMQVTFEIELPEDNLSASNLYGDFVKQLVKVHGRETVDLNTHSYRLHTDYTSWQVSARDVDLVFLASTGSKPLMNLVYQEHNPGKRKRLQDSFK